jgi:hypothetical protein
VQFGSYDFQLLGKLVYVLLQQHKVLGLSKSFSRMWLQKMSISGEVPWLISFLIRLFAMPIPQELMSYGQGFPW